MGFNYTIDNQPDSAVVWLTNFLLKVDFEIKIALVLAFLMSCLRVVILTKTKGISNQKVSVLKKKYPLLNWAIFFSDAKCLSTQVVIQLGIVSELDIPS